MLLGFTEFIFLGALKLSSQCPSEEVQFIKLHLFWNLPVFLLSWQWCYIIFTWMVCQSSELLRRLKFSEKVHKFLLKFSSSKAFWDILFVIAWYCEISANTVFCFILRVMFSMEYDILTRFKVETQFSVLLEHKMCSKHYLNFMITCKPQVLWNIVWEPVHVKNILEKIFSTLTNTGSALIVPF